MSDQKNSEQQSLIARIAPHKGSVFVALTALLVNLGIWFFMYFKRQSNEYPLPLYYDVYQGVSVIDFWSNLFYLPILGLVIIAINYVLSVVIVEKDVMISYFLNIASIVVQIILFVALFWIVYLQNDLFQL